LIGFERWVGRTDAGITLDFETAGRINDSDQANLPEIVDHHRALGVKFPFVVRCSDSCWCWFGEFGVTVVAAREFGVLKECSNPCTTGERMLSPERIGAQFGQNCIGCPAGMGAT
jgi:hypothetical protein